MLKVDYRLGVWKIDSSRFSDLLNTHIKFGKNPESRFGVVRAIAKISVYGEILYVSSRCHVLRTLELQRICIGAYPGEIYAKYQDEVMEIGELYAIFQLIGNSDNGYLISHYFNPLFMCVKAKFIEPDQLNCTTKNEITEQITIAGNLMFCINQNMQMVDDLLKFCTGKQMNPSEFVALQYSLYEEPTVVSNTDAVMCRMPVYFIVSTILYLIEKTKIVLLIFD